MQIPAGQADATKFVNAYAQKVKSNEETRLIYSNLLLIFSYVLKLAVAILSYTRFTPYKETIYTHSMVQS
jgi:hypothetical protein